MDKKFWKAAGVRMVKTAAQTALALIPAAGMLQDVSWGVVLSTAALSALASLLTSIVTGLPEVDE